MANDVTGKSLIALNEIPLDNLISAPVNACINMWVISIL